MAPQVPCHLEPAPFEPPGLLGQALSRCGRIPLVHAAGIEEQDAVDGLGVRAVRVAIDDHIGARKPAFQSAGQAAMWCEVTEAQGPQERDWLFEPVTALSVDDRNPFSLHADRARHR